MKIVQSTRKNWHHTTRGNSLQHQRGSQTRAQYDLLQQLFFNNRRSKIHLRLLQNRSYSRKTACTSSAVVLLLSMMGDSSLCRRKEKHSTDQQRPGDPNRDWHRPFHKRGEGLHPGAGDLLVREVWEKICLRYRLLDDCAMNWCVLSLGKQEETRHQQKGKSTITCCTDKFVPLVAVSQQKVAPSNRHEPARENPVPDSDVAETMRKLLKLFAETLIDDDAVLVRETRPAERAAERAA